MSIFLQIWKLGTMTSFTPVQQWTYCEPSTVWGGNKDFIILLAFILSFSLPNPQSCPLLLQLVSIPSLLEARELASAPSLLNSSLPVTCDLINPHAFPNGLHWRYSGNVALSWLTLCLPPWWNDCFQFTYHHLAEECPMWRCFFLKYHSVIYYHCQVLLEPIFQEQ